MLVRILQICAMSHHVQGLTGVSGCQQQLLQCIVGRNGSKASCNGSCLLLPRGLDIVIWSCPLADYCSQPCLTDLRYSTRHSPLICDLLSIQDYYHSTAVTTVTRYSICPSLINYAQAFAVRLCLILVVILSSVHFTIVAPACLSAFDVSFHGVPLTICLRS